ncbi:hypothetical protein BLNAU_154 [Blattamonas nauphoetae]|uniref:Uncharacterized protein n=1 Tax=Blattamonas nauphoetae TaxID=2049346 RepID=A0ABQ9YM72_9EUKA|nr:hypothetical protein BLNAU_154 [Blattamonas nauphoetae]
MSTVKEPPTYYNRIHPPKYLIVADILYWVAHLVIFLIIFIIFMVVRAITVESTWNETGDARFFIELEPDTSSKVELVGDCNVIAASKWVNNNMEQEEITETHTLGSISIPAYYHSNVVVRIDTPLACSYDFTVSTTDRPTQTISQAAGWSGDISFDLEFHTYTLRATPTSGSCTTLSAAVTVFNGTMDETEIVEEPKCPDGICKGYKLYYIERAEGATECWARGHKSIFPLPVFLIIFTILSINLIIHWVFMLWAPHPIERIFRKKYEKEKEN